MQAGYIGAQGVQLPTRDPAWILSSHSHAASSFSSSQWPYPTGPYPFPGPHTKSPTSKDSTIHKSHIQTFMTPGGPAQWRSEEIRRPGQTAGVVRSEDLWFPEPIFDTVLLPLTTGVRPGRPPACPLATPLARAANNTGLTVSNLEILY